MTNPTDREFEQLLQDKGLNAPRITPADIEANIVAVHYFTALDGALGEAASNCDADTKLGDIVYLDGTPDEVSLGLLTFCVIVLKNGFTVTGESACASPENFDAEAGRIAARRNAENKIWPLMGYELKCRLSQEVK